MSDIYISFAVFIKKDYLFFEVGDVFRGKCIINEIAAISVLLATSVVVVVVVSTMQRKKNINEPIN